MLNPTSFSGGGTLQLVRTDNSNPFFGTLIRALDEDLLTRYPDIQAQYTPHNAIAASTPVVIALLDNEPAGCGCFKKLDDDTVEIKRMYVVPAFRNKHIAGTILTELETWAKELSFSRAVLELANRQPEALHLYKKIGYTVTENYGPYIGMENSICLCRILR
jgi:putative acetyltransferase